MTPLHWHFFLMDYWSLFVVFFNLLNSVVPGNGILIVYIVDNTDFYQQKSLEHTTCNQIKHAYYIHENKMHGAFLRVDILYDEQNHLKFERIKNISVERNTRITHQKHY